MEEINFKTVKCTENISETPATQGSLFESHRSKQCSRTMWMQIGRTSVTYIWPSTWSHLMASVDSAG